MKCLKIKSVNHGETKSDRNRYCGPAVISAITGMTTGEAARLIRHVSGKYWNGRRAVKGTTVLEVTEALEMCGVKSKYQSFGMKLNSSTGPTLAGWLKATVKERTADRVFLIVAGWHWQLVQGRRIVCGILSEPASIRDKRVKRRARVANVYELRSMGAITTPSQACKPKRKPDPNAAARRKAKKLMAQYDFEVDYDSEMRTYWVSMTEEAENLATELEHHLRDEHYVDDWEQILWRMEDMAQFMDHHFPKKKAA